jgi:hypothetical protein
VGANIAAGRQVALTATGRFAGKTSKSLNTVFNGPWFRELPDFGRSPERFLRQGGYVAKIKNSPFLAQALDSSAEMTEEAYVVGILKEEAQP